MKLKELYAKKRQILADMKTAGIKKMSCMNRMDNQSYKYNLELQLLDLDIRKAKAANR